MASDLSVSIDDARKILQECSQSAGREVEIREKMVAECEAMVKELKETVVKPAESAMKRAEDNWKETLMTSVAPPSKSSKSKSTDLDTTKLDRCLEKLPDGASVAMIVMLGSLCPITLGHVQCYVEARRMLLDKSGMGAARPARLEHFDECIGLVWLNGDGMVSAKLEDKGQKTIYFSDRRHLVTLATAEYPWLCYDDFSLETELPKRWPNLRFTEFDMNGADDVVKYEKWRFVGPDCRRITIGRPGSTAAVLDGMRSSGVDPDDGYFFLTPDLPDISSTAARDASARGDIKTLLTMLHPAVADWLLCRDGHKGLATTKLDSMLAQKQGAPAAKASGLKSPGAVVKLPALAPSRVRGRSSGKVEVSSSSRRRGTSMSGLDAANSSQVVASSRARARSTGRLDGAYTSQAATLSRPPSGGNSSQSPLGGSSGQASAIPKKPKSGARVDPATAKRAAAKASASRRSSARAGSPSSAGNRSAAISEASAEDAESEHSQLVRTAWSLILGKSAEPPPMSLLKLREQLRVHLVEEDAEGLPRDEALRAMDGLLQWELKQKTITNSRDLARTGLDHRMALWQGDITTLHVGAIVNAANTKGLGCFKPDHRCIDNIIHCAAGPALRVACFNELQQERWKGRLPTGDAMVTAAFNLPCDCVIHVPGPQCPDGVEQPEMLARCYNNVLEACRMHSIRSVAFCCISTGLFGYPAKSAAKVAVSTVRQWLDEHSDGDFIDLVVFNVFLKSDLHIYEELLA